MDTITRLRLIALFVLTILALLISLLAVGIAAKASEITSKKDSSGYTHYRGNHVTGTSHVDSSGYTHESWEVNRKRFNCTIHTDSSKITHRNCN